MNFLEQEEIVVDKKTKKSETSVDIKPMITLVAFDEAEYQDKLPALLLSKEDTLETSSLKGYFIKADSVAEQYENGIKVYLQVDTGSAVNLKPELVMEAFYNKLGIPFEKYAWQVHRLEVYTKNEEQGKLIALNKLEG